MYPRKDSRRGPQLREAASNGNLLQHILEQGVITPTRKEIHPPTRQQSSREKEGNKTGVFSKLSGNASQFGALYDKRHLKKG